VLALSAAGGSRPQAHASLPQPDLDRPSSAEPGYLPSQGGPSEPEEPLATTRYLRVTGSVLRPRENDVDYAWGAGGGCIYVKAGDDFTVWNTPIYLPQGATVTQLRMFVNDASTSNCQGFFSVYDLWGDLVYEWSATSNTSSGLSYWDAAIPDHIIDYETYSYVVNWRPQDTGADMQLCGFRLSYTPPLGSTFVPSVMYNHGP